MLSPYREEFNARWTPAGYERLLNLLTQRTGAAVPFRICETPCFFPRALLERMAEDGKALITQLVGNPAYHAASQPAIPPEFNCPQEDAKPLWVQADFGLVRDGAGEWQPKLVEIQGFPSLYAFQPTLAEAYREAYALDADLQTLLGGLTTRTYHDLFCQAVLQQHDPAEVVLLEIDPLRQKTLPDFVETESCCGVPAVDIMDVVKQGNKLFYPRDGRLVPIRRIYNRVIIDELVRKGLQPAFSFRDDLDVEWAGHPNWFFRLSKFSIPFLKHPSVPRSWFFDQIPELPDDPANLVLKPLFSFAGLGVLVGPTREQLDTIPRERRGDYILQERVRFTPAIQTPHGPTQAEIRIMYIWQQDLTAATTIIRMGRGRMMGVDHNRDLEWVGASAGLSPA